jgi:phosphohistidine swiveling domain-containing protein
MAMIAGVAIIYMLLPKKTKEGVKTDLLNLISYYQTAIPFVGLEGIVSTLYMSISPVLVSLYAWHEGKIDRQVIDEENRRLLDALANWNYGLTAKPLATASSTTTERALATKENPVVVKVYPDNTDIVVDISLNITGIPYMTRVSSPLNNAGTLADKLVTVLQLQKIPVGKFMSIESKPNDLGLDFIIEEISPEMIRFSRKIPGGEPGRDLLSIDVNVHELNPYLSDNLQSALMKMMQPMVAANAEEVAAAKPAQQPRPGTTTHVISTNAALRTDGPSEPIDSLYLVHALDAAHKIDNFEKPELVAKMLLSGSAIGPGFVRTFGPSGVLVDVDKDDILLTFPGNADVANWHGGRDYSDSKLVGKIIADLRDRRARNPLLSFNKLIDLCQERNCAYNEVDFVNWRIAGVFIKDDFKNDPAFKNFPDEYQQVVNKVKEFALRHGLPILYVREDGTVRKSTLSGQTLEGIRIESMFPAIGSQESSSLETMKKNLISLSAPSTVTNPAGQGTATEPKTFRAGMEVYGLFYPDSGEMVIDLEKARDTLRLYFGAHFGWTEKDIEVLSDDKIKGLIHCHEIFHQLETLTGIKSNEELANIFAMNAIGLTIDANEKMKLNGLIRQIKNSKIDERTKDLILKQFELEYSSPEFLLNLNSPNRLGVDILKISSDNISSVPPGARAMAVPEEAITINGEALSNGVAQGKTVINSRETFESLVTSKHEFPNGLTERDVNAAIAKSVLQLQYIKDELGEYPQLAAIFEAHIQMLNDRFFKKKIMDYINEGYNPAQAILKAGKDNRDAFLRSSNDNLRQRAWDLCDITTRLLNNLLNKSPAQAVGAGKVVVANELYSSDMLETYKGAKAIVVFNSALSAQSHAAIIAKRLDIPMVVVNSPEVMDISNGANIIVDADKSTVSFEKAAGADVAQQTIVPSAIVATPVQIDYSVIVSAFGQAVAPVRATQITDIQKGDPNASVCVKAYDELVEGMAPLFAGATIVYPFMGPDIEFAKYFPETIVPISDDAKDIGRGQAILKTAGVATLNDAVCKRLIEAYEKKPNATNIEEYRNISGPRVLVMKGFAENAEIYGGIALIRKIVNELKPGDKILVLDARELNLLRRAALLPSGNFSYKISPLVIWQDAKLFQIPDVVCLFERTDVGVRDTMQEFGYEPNPDVLKTIINQSAVAVLLPATLPVVKIDETKTSPVLRASSGITAEAETRIESIIDENATPDNLEIIVSDLQKQFVEHGYPPGEANGTIQAFCTEMLQNVGRAGNGSQAVSARVLFYEYPNRLEIVISNRGEADKAAIDKKLKISAEAAAKKLTAAGGTGEDGINGDMGINIPNSMAEALGGSVHYDFENGFIYAIMSIPKQGMSPADTAPATAVKSIVKNVSDEALEILTSLIDYGITPDEINKANLTTPEQVENFARERNLADKVKELLNRWLAISHKLATTVAVYDEGDGRQHSVYVITIDGNTYTLEVGDRGTFTAVAAFSTAPAVSVEIARSKGGKLIAQATTAAVAQANIEHNYRNWVVTPLISEDEGKRFAKARETIQSYNEKDGAQTRAKYYRYKDGDDETTFKNSIRESLRMIMKEMTAVDTSLDPRIALFVPMRISGSSKTGFAVAAEVLRENEFDSLKEKGGEGYVVALLSDNVPAENVGRIAEAQHIDFGVEWLDFVRRGAKYSIDEKSALADHVKTCVESASIKGMNADEILEGIRKGNIVLQMIGPVDRDKWDKEQETYLKLRVAV